MKPYMTKPTSIFKFIVVHPVALLALMFSWSALAAKADDIRIVIDVSGSMVKTDPHNLRVPALRLMTGLIPSGGRAGVWTFGRYTNRVVKWGIVDDHWRKLAREGAKKINSRGQFTNIEGAIKRATSGWDKPSPGSRRSLILLTDGKVDISKKAAKNAASRQRILQQTIPRLVKRGIKVYTIALSDRTDETLLKQLALKTAGSFEIAHNAKQLQRIFLRMFERAAKPDSVPLKGNKFTIDKSIREMTLLVFRKGKKETGLIEPGGTRHRFSKHGGKVQWRFEQGYDLITVKKPHAGVWTLDAEIDPDNRVMIVTDLKLKVNDIPAYLTPDQSIDIQLELHNKNNKIRKHSFLKFVDFSVTHQLGDKTEKLSMHLKKYRQLKDKGIYQQQIKAPLREGRHEILVQADARTFNRSKRFSIEVQWPIKVRIEKTRHPGVYRLSIEAREEYIKADSLRLAVKLKKPDGTSDSIVMKADGKVWHAQIHADQADGLHQIMIGMQAQSTEGVGMHLDLQPYPVIGVKAGVKAPEKASGIRKKRSKAKQTAPAASAAAIKQQTSESTTDDWVRTTIIIVSINLVLLVLVFGAWILWRKRRSIDVLDSLYEADETAKNVSEDKQ